MIDQLQCLRQLDLKKITEDERRMASIVVRKEEEKRKECSKVLNYVFKFTELKFGVRHITIRTRR